MKVTVDQEGRLVCMSPAFVEELGFQPADHLGSLPPFPWWPTEDRILLSEWSHLILSGFASKVGLDTAQLTFMRANGEPVSCTTRSEIVDDGSRRLYVWHLSLARKSRLTEPEHLDEITRSCRGILENLRALGVPSAQTPVAPSAQVSAQGLLSRREREILPLLLDGGRPGEIARVLSVSPHTARNHTKSIFRKLGVHSQIELIQRYRLGPSA